jgi:hypothetical protein
MDLTSLNPCYWTPTYRELQGGVWDFVSLRKAAKAAKMGILQVVNLLRIANNYLPSVQRRYEQRI